MEKSLSEQIERADASEFVRFAEELARLLRPDTSEGLKILENHEWMHNFYYPFAHCLARKESHIAAAIMLMKVTGAGSQMSFSANHLVKEPYSVRLYDIDGYMVTHTTHTTLEMALLAAIAKKLESE